MFSFLASGADGTGTPAWAMLAYLVAGVLFILALRGLSSPSTSRAGNRNGMIGMLIAVVTTLVTHSIANIAEIGIAIAIGGLIGFTIARKIAMTDMPQLVAGFHSLVGLAAVLVGCGCLSATRLLSALLVEALRFIVAAAAAWYMLSPVSRIETWLWASQLVQLPFPVRSSPFSSWPAQMSGSADHASGAPCYQSGHAGRDHWSDRDVRDGRPSPGSIWRVQRCWHSSSASC